MSSSPRETRESRALRYLPVRAAIQDAGRRCTNLYDRRSRRPALSATRPAPTSAAASTLGVVGLAPPGGRRHAALAQHVLRLLQGIDDGARVEAQHPGIALRDVVERRRHLLRRHVAGDVDDLVGGAGDDAQQVGVAVGLAHRRIRRQAADHVQDLVAQAPVAGDREAEGLDVDAEHRVARRGLVEAGLLAGPSPLAGAGCISCRICSASSAKW